MVLTLSRWSSLLFAVTLISTAFAAPSHGRNRFSTFSHKNTESVLDDQCTEPVHRKEWRQLTDNERKDYIAAVKCLHTLPARTTDMVPGASSRYEDFIGVHKIMVPQVKLTGQFLPWYRYFLALYEKALREECGYKGGQPYWDVSLDVSPTAILKDSPIFSTTTGFGGDGDVESAGCVYPDNPFGNWTIHLEGSTRLGRSDHCLSRNLNPMIGYQWLRRSQGNEDEIMEQPDFGRMWKLLEAEPSFEDFVVGGSASDVFSSNAEPLFYLHYTNLDRIWWQWQSTSDTNTVESADSDPLLSAKLFDISTEISPESPPAEEYSQGKGRLFDISGKIAPSHPVFLPTPRPVFHEGNVTLNFELYVGKLDRVAHVWEVMDIGGSGPGRGPGVLQDRKYGLLCYEYL